MPCEPPKFAGRDGVCVLGASCGGAHTAFLLRTVVDAKEDYREDQQAAAAAVIESFFRGNHVRVLNDAVAHRKHGGRADHLHSLGQREAAAKVIQAGWRLHKHEADRERRDQLDAMRALRDPADEEDWWGRVQRQFGAAVTGKAFADAGAAARVNVTKASW